MLEDECENIRTQGASKFGHDHLLPKSSSECDVSLPIPETEVSEDTQAVFGKETDDFTQPMNSTVSMLDKSGPGTERGAMQYKTTSVAPASSRFREEDILTQRSGLQQSVQNYHLLSINPCHPSPSKHHISGYKCKNSPSGRR